MDERWRAPASIATLVLLALSCEDPEPDFPTSLADGAIRGTVTASGGRPLASVRMGVHPPTADVGKYEIGHSNSATNSAGAYELGVAVLEGEFPAGIPDILQLYLIAESSGDSAVIDSVLVPVAFAEAGEHFIRTHANVKLHIP